MVLQACSCHMPQTQLHPWPASIRSTTSLACLHQRDWWRFGTVLRGIYDYSIVG
jgi:hypothetical protein